MSWRNTRNTMLVNSIEYGSIQKVEVGPILVNKKIYMPTIERLNNWIDLVETQEWFKGFQVIFTGGFTNHIRRDQIIWPTWDIDVILVSDKNLNTYEEIKFALIECSKIALNECSFFMDIHYEKNRYDEIHHNKRIQNEESVYYEKLTRPTNKVPMEYVPVLNYSEDVKRNDKIVTKWGKGVEIINGLWGRRLWFPSYKQLERLKKGMLYSKPIFLKEYKEKYYKELSVI